jgi:hypothetical protein
MRYGKNGKDKVNKYGFVRYEKLNHFLDQNQEYEWALTQMYTVLTKKMYSTQYEYMY